MYKLMLVAHPDDEVVFGWPFWDEATHVLFCSDDSRNPKRQDQKRVAAYREVARVLGVEAASIPEDCEFYRLPTRYTAYTLSDFIERVGEAIEKISPDLIFTHNAIGEYGHLDHQLVHTIALQAGVGVVTTDIFIESNWCPFTDFEVRGQKIKEVVLDEDVYQVCQRIYEKHNAWTWDKPPVRKVGVYRL